MDQPIRIVHLCKGGEVLDGIAVSMMTYIGALPQYQHEVVSILPSSHLSRALADAKTIRTRIQWDNADVVVAWGHAAHLVSRLIAWRSLPVIWNLRDSGPGKHPLVDFIIRLNRKASYRTPRKIICVAESTERYYQKRGYDASKFMLIPNGVDTDFFRPDPTTRISIRQSWGFSEDAPVIGMVGRYSPEKGFDVFLETVKLIRQRLPEARFVVCGSGTTSRAWIREVKKAGLSQVVLSLGMRKAMPEFYAGIDALVQPMRAVDASSRCVLEALSCGVPCIATDVGDNKIMIGEAGVIVPINDPAAMQQAFSRLWGMGQEGRQSLSQHCRQRILDHYTVEKTASLYAELFASLAGSSQKG